MIMALRVPSVSVGFPIGFKPDGGQTMERRFFLQSMVAWGAFLIGGLPRILQPAQAANEAVQRAFETSLETDALAALFPGMRAEPSEKVKLTAPYLALPNQAISVRVDCPHTPVQAIAITAAQAKRPLVAVAAFFRPGRTFTTPMLLAQTSQINAFVLTEDGLFSASHLTKVTGGGYGMHFD